MKQALKAYHQDMLVSGKYSSLNAVQQWDDLHSTLTSLTNKFIPSKPEMISLGSAKNSNGLLDKETELFRNIGNQVNPLIEKTFPDLNHLFRKSIKLSYQSYLEDILDVAATDLTSKPNTKKTLYTSKTFKTRFCLCCTTTQTQFCPPGRHHESHYS